MSKSIEIYASQVLKKVSRFTEDKELMQMVWFEKKSNTHRQLIDGLDRRGSISIK